MTDGIDSKRLNFLDAHDVVRIALRPRPKLDAQDAAAVWNDPTSMQFHCSSFLIDKIQDRWRGDGTRDMLFLAIQDTDGDKWLPFAFFRAGRCHMDRLPRVDLNILNDDAARSSGDFKFRFLLDPAELAKGRFRWLPDNPVVRSTGPLLQMCR